LGEGLGKVVKKGWVNKTKNPILVISTAWVTMAKTPKTHLKP